MPIAFATFQVTKNHMHSQKIIKNECQFLRIKNQSHITAFFEVDSKFILYIQTIHKWQKMIATSLCVNL